MIYTSHTNCKLLTKAYRTTYQIAAPRMRASRALPVQAVTKRRCRRPLPFMEGSSMSSFIFYVTSRRNLSNMSLNHTNRKRHILVSSRSFSESTIQDTNFKNKRGFHWYLRAYAIGIVVFPYALLSLIPTYFTIMSIYHKLSGSPHQVSRGYSFFAVTGFLSLPLSFILLISSPFILAFDYNKRQFFNWIQHIWAKLSCYPFLEAHIEGLELLEMAGKEPVVYVSNHQSWLDIYVLLATGVPIKFISKREIFYIPVVGWCMGLIGHISLRRGDKSSGKEVLQHCKNYLQRGVSVFFFPEGTRSRVPGELNPFKIGAFKVAVSSQVPIVPIIITGTERMMPADSSIWLDIDKGDLKITVLETIVPNHDTTPQELLDETFKRMSSIY